MFMVIPLVVEGRKIYVAKSATGAALKQGFWNPETESRKRKRITESVKEGSKRSIGKKMLAMTIK